MSVLYLGFQYLWKEGIKKCWVEMFLHSISLLPSVLGFPGAVRATEAEHPRLQWGVLLQSSAWGFGGWWGNPAWSALSLHLIMGCTEAVSWNLLQAMLERIQLTKFLLCLNGLIPQGHRIHLHWAQRWEGRKKERNQCAERASVMNQVQGKWSCVLCRFVQDFSLTSLILQVRNLVLQAVN